MASSKKQMSADTLLGILGGISGIVGAVASLGWFVRSVLVVVALGLIIFAARRHHSPAWLRIVCAVLVTVLLVAVTWRPIWDDFHKDYPMVAFHWPVTFTEPEMIPSQEAQELPDLPPATDLPGPPQSKWGHMVFLCVRPKVTDKRDPEEIKAQFRQDAEAFGDTFGLSIVLTDISYGIRVDFTAKTPGDPAVTHSLNRFTIEERGTSKGILVTLTVELPGALAILGSIPAERNSDLTVLYTKMVTKLNGVPEDRCRVL